MINNGNFFLPAYPKVDGITETFFYKSVTNIEGQEAQNMYPIYVVLKKHSITFHFSGKIHTNSKPNFVFGQYTIADIIYSENREMENSEITKLYNRKLSLDLYENAYLVDHDNIVRKNSFSNLQVFGLSGLQWRSIQFHSKDCPLRRIFCRRLLLDFLDDLFDGNVFDVYPDCNLVKEWIKTTKLYGIYLKGDFYRKKVMFDENRADWLIHVQYFESLEKWIKYITTESHKYYFKTKQDFDDQKNKIESWFGYDDAEIINALSNNACKILAWENPKREEKRKDIVERSINHLIKNSAIFKAWMVFCNNGYWNTNLLLPRIAIVLIASWVAIVTCTDFWKVLIFLPFSIAVLIGFVFITITSIFIYLHIKKTSRIDSFFKVFTRTIEVVSFGLLYSSIIGLIGSFLVSLYLDESDAFRPVISQNKIVEVNQLVVSRDSLLREKDLLNLQKLILADNRLQSNKKEKIPFNNGSRNLIAQNDSVDYINSDTGKINKYLISIDYKLDTINESLKSENIFANLSSFHLIKNSKKVTENYRVKIINTNSNEKIMWLGLFPSYQFLMTCFAFFSGLFLTLIFDDKRSVTDSN